MTLKKGDVLVKLVGGRSRRAEVLSPPRRVGTGLVVAVMSLGWRGTSSLLTLGEDGLPTGWAKETP